MASYISSQNGIFAKLKIFSIVGPAKIQFYRKMIILAFICMKVGLVGLTRATAIWISFVVFSTISNTYSQSVYNCCFFTSLWILSQSFFSFDTESLIVVRPLIVDQGTSEGYQYWMADQWLWRGERSVQNEPNCIKPKMILINFIILKIL